MPSGVVDSWAKTQNPKPTCEPRWRLPPQLDRNWTRKTLSLTPFTPIVWAKCQPLKPTRMHNNTATQQQMRRLRRRRPSFPLCDGALETHFFPILHFCVLYLHPSRLFWTRWDESVMWRLIGFDILGLFNPTCACIISGIYVVHLMPITPPPSPSPFRTANVLNTARQGKGSRSQRPAKRFQFV